MNQVEVALDTIPVHVTVNSEPRLSHRPSGLYPMFLLAVLATVMMLFAAFTAALIVRRNGSDWVPVQIPSVAWLNTLFIVTSSILLECAKKAFSRGNGPRASLWLGYSIALGVLFLIGQLIAWSVLKNQGFLLSTNTHAAFFYMLSGVHGAHVLGGIGVLVWTLRRALAGAYGIGQYRGVAHAAIYWHCVGAVWIHLLILLSIT